MPWLVYCGRHRLPWWVKFSLPKHRSLSPLYSPGKILEFLLFLCLKSKNFIFSVFLFDFFNGKNVLNMRHNCFLRSGNRIFHYRQVKICVQTICLRYSGKRQSLTKLYRFLVKQLFDKCYCFFGCMQFPLIRLSHGTLSESV